MCRSLTDGSGTDFPSFVQFSRLVTELFWSFSDLMHISLCFLSRKQGSVKCLTNKARAYASSLRSMQRYLGKKDFPFIKLSSRIISDYQGKLLASGICDNTIGFYLHNIKTLFRKGCREMGLELPCPFRDISIKMEKTLKRFLDGKTYSFGFTFSGSFFVRDEVPLTVDGKINFKSMNDNRMTPFYCRFPLGAYMLDSGNNWQSPQFHPAILLEVEIIKDTNTVIKEFILNFGEKRF